ncbi:hypothetical protein CKO35_16715 [Ectothiorhodospira shaposhnikovii]|uniref:flagellar filament capping protein FliD n=1 Tax=Ectothiorhodospira shaposhnikovii TaxID=1054 RepID=UPI00190692A9|nr:flagellar filament capping protein FliD [Ectothiorhodospira shaposhnikovii]MBK1674897.1 hypothetical protein [Ectothiorhodospira shaposhnikovii]
MATISSLGIGSGIDVRGLVDQLVAAERAPADRRLDQREERLEASLSGFGQLKSALADFNKALEALSKPADFRTVTARAGNDSVLDVAASRDAPAGTYDVEVQQLAQAQRLTTRAGLFGDNFTANTQLGSGDLRITLADGKQEVIRLESATTTLESLQKEINRQSSHLRASVVDDGDNGQRLIITSNRSGAESAISRIEVENAVPTSALLNELAFDASALSGDDPPVSGGFAQLRAGQDALALVDGMQVRRSNNNFDDVIDGVRMTLQDLGTSRVSVTESQGAAREAIEGFVEAYNTLLGHFSELGAYNPDTRVSGPLNGDSTLRIVQSRLAQVVSGMGGSEAGGIRSLGEIGISTQRDGSLGLDIFKLDEQIAGNWNGVVDLFTHEQNGIAGRLGAIVEEFTGRDSIINTRTDTLQESLRGLADQRTQLDVRMERTEARLIAQFTAMDQVVAQMNQTSTFLENQMAQFNSMMKQRSK